MWFDIFGIQTWWEEKVNAFFIYLNEMAFQFAVIGCAGCIILYAVTQDKKFMQWVWIILAIFIMYKGATMVL